MAIAILFFSFLSAVLVGSAAYLETGSLLMALLGYSWGGAGMMGVILLTAATTTRRATADLD